MNKICTSISYILWFTLEVENTNKIVYYMWTKFQNIFFTYYQKLIYQFVLSGFLDNIKLKEEIKNREFFEEIKSVEKLGNLSGDEPTNPTNLL